MGLMEPMAAPHGGCRARPSIRVDVCAQWLHVDRTAAAVQMVYPLKHVEAVQRAIRCHRAALGGAGGTLCLAQPTLHTGSSGVQGAVGVQTQPKPQAAAPIGGTGPELVFGKHAKHSRIYLESYPPSLSGCRGLM